MHPKTANARFPFFPNLGVLLCQQFKVVFLLCHDLLPYMASVAWVHPKTANTRFPFFPNLGVLLCQQFKVVFLLCDNLLPYMASEKGKCSFSDFFKMERYVMSAVRCT